MLFLNVSRIYLLEKYKRKTYLVDASFCLLKKKIKLLVFLNWIII
jgi:hypothetical protein